MKTDLLVIFLLVLINAANITVIYVMSKRDKKKAKNDNDCEMQQNWRKDE